MGGPPTSGPQGTPGVHPEAEARSATPARQAKTPAMTMIFRKASMLKRISSSKELGEFRKKNSNPTL
ncbi:hypothetical protein KIH39_19140 [Telmatocola sphagniphila]|jgi:hypothetical protein|uniref:Uncharacterized protein n=1 Tax=Telmatocola sphagniphila TaxID=1123043 RepID=A0A8E6B5U7_9BACT|nr:hypothetical protein [Telmatocola sphagniphila]QVL30950.1 hypothetical protein KIH39_19140 [Telmatocola sphagniphila]